MTRALQGDTALGDTLAARGREVRTRREVVGRLARAQRGAHSAARAMRTLLLLSRHFPPRFDVGGKRAYRFARHLPRFGWRPVVLTAPIPNGPVDPTAGLPLPPEAIVVRRYHPRPWPRGGPRDSDGTLAEPTRARRDADRGALPWLRARLATPLDADLLLVPYIAGVVRTLHARWRFDAVFATSSPYSTLLLGAVARAVTGAPLCLDLRDPWSLNFLQRRRPAWVRRVEAALERVLLHSADRVTFTSEATAAAYREALGLPAERVRCIYNAFDPEQRPARARPDPHEPVCLVHFGNCYGERTLEPVLRALARIVQRRRLGPADVRLLNLGRVSAADLELARRLGIGALFEWRPVVPYEEGLVLLARADLAILLSYGRETLFVPAKFFDYLLAGTPMLCVAEPSELTTLVERTRTGRYASPDDVETIERLVEEAIDRHRSGRDPPPRDEAAVAEYEAPRAAARLAALLDEMVRDRLTTG
ncbi:MAG: glycosyltransferase [Myxococcota bacterium]|nr:glycosyltransferase [Myxococcota bacterium]